MLSVCCPTSSHSVQAGGKERVKGGTKEWQGEIVLLLFHDVPLKKPSVHHSVQFSNYLKVKMFVYNNAIQFLANEFCSPFVLYDRSGPHHSDGSAGQREGRRVHLDCCG